MSTAGLRHTKAQSTGATDLRAQLLRVALLGHTDFQGRGPCLPPPSGKYR